MSETGTLVMFVVWSAIAGHGGAWVCRSSLPLTGASEVTCKP